MKKKYAWYVLAIGLAITLALIGTGHAGWSGEDKSEAETGKSGVMEPRDPGTDAEAVAPGGDQIVVSGMINDSSQLVDDSGYVYELADTGQGAEVKSMIGKKIQIKGTVLEEEGRASVEVHDYTILE
ncbi:MULTISPECIES: hypothetical protein [Desulfococcus]|jgi:hypothetical protein|uniref:Uncharacterized protein n=1 Tax=Desulfococcus multivorans DSM 2059 TaxID=1121405 RepID=S7TQB5_DESML|nr:hypothetical protein [Desulfococcus multivorans]AOY57756.1 uncharacterized protein Dmul_09810 [Desulfococcus multivorans]AQV00146.1 hypothetical protein B2D07_04740 [Desulfococcus multivorans]EPR38840.1 hypothetical protein dsmv_0250 [Desulfococcus multivorans DSM 2059]MDX9817510.1 hypothetical protein [Desulfococcus multivorans]SJZ80783.1 hypothetical protein SAMN02745446_01738 [Desulfococcus multivorans DSM 2059]